MLDIFKGAAITAITWMLAFSYASRFHAGFFWLLPSAAFVLPLLWPNGRWLLGNVIFCAGAITFLVASADDSLGATLGIAMLAWVAVATVLGTAARFAIREVRVRYRKLTHAPPLPQNELPPISRRDVLLTGCAVLGLLAMYSLYVMYSARASAQRIAAGRPYCVQVASRDTYRSVTSSLDLLGFRMMGNGSVRHAVLAVKNGSAVGMYHWSYFKDTFVADISAQRPIFCDLIPDFLAHPRRYRQEAQSSLSFLLKGRSFSIPKRYAPTLSSAGLIEIEVPGSIKVEITPGRDGKLDGWRIKPEAGWLVESLGDEHGLIKERVRTRGSRSTPELQFYELDSLGQVKTLVSCADAASSNCVHIFSDGRLSYFFRHPLSKLSNWRQMQQTLSARAATFID